jgi:pyruvate-formate lyase-activating enzyme
MFKCGMPFRNIHFGADRFVTCCPAWVDDTHHIPKFEIENAWDVWNHPKFIEMRESVLDGSYRYCQTCPAYNNEESWTQTQDEDSLPVMKIGPKVVNLAHDISCNLHCGSCRKSSTILPLEEQERKIKNVHMFMDEFLPGVEILRLNNSGDIFASKTTMQWLQTLDATKLPSLKICIFTNGLLLPKQWHKLANIHDRIDAVWMSIDGATKDTYEALRRGGKWEDLQVALEFIGNLRATKQINSFHTLFVVQQQNFREMPAFVELCQRHRADYISFNPLQKWDMPLEEYNSKSMSNPNHPQMAEFLKVLEHPSLQRKHVNIMRVMPEFRAVTHKKYN